MKRNEEEIEIGQAWIEDIFARKMHELKEIIHRTEVTGQVAPYDVTSVAGLLRDLVYDHPLYERVNRFHRMEIVVPICIHSSWKEFSNPKNLPDHYSKYCGPVVLAMTDSWYPVKIQKYLTDGLVGVIVMGEEIKPGEAIRYYANVLGGRHLDGKIKGGDIKTMNIDNALNISGLPVVARMLMRRIAPDLIRALAPLEEVVHANIATAQ